MQHVISFSGGKASFAAAARVVETYGRDAVTLVFADTLIEDDDLYRFLLEGQDALHCELVWLRDGRTPWGVFRDRKYIGNTRTAPCSHELKTKQVRQWMEANCDPADTMLHIGMSWDEQERLPRARKNWSDPRCLPVIPDNYSPEVANAAIQELILGDDWREGVPDETVFDGWFVEAPLCWEPLWTKVDVDACLERYGLIRPRLYEYGFAHNNCGGFCVRAGQGQMQALYQAMPERYLWHEEQMEAVMRDVPNARPFLRQSTSRGLEYITLREWREQMDAQPDLDLEPTGGCGCFID